MIVNKLRSLSFRKFQMLKLRKLQFINQNIRSFETLSINSVNENVMHVQLNMPERRNAMNKTFWSEIGTCFEELDENPKCRAIVLSGTGSVFSSGIDFKHFGELVPMFQSEEEIARKFKKIYGYIKMYQHSFSALEKCSKPVIAAIHNACLGAAVDLIVGADIRYCSSDAWFQIKEVDLGLAADVGILQRLPKIVGNDSLVRELTYSSRKFLAEEAKSFGIVSQIFADKQSMIDAAIKMASTIASKSPVAVQGTKIHLNYSRDHTVQESLQFQAIWNASMLQSEDLMKSAMAQMNKVQPAFDDL